MRGGAWARLGPSTTDRQNGGSGNWAGAADDGRVAIESSQKNVAASLAFCFALRMSACLAHLEQVAFVGCFAFWQQA